MTTHTAPCCPSLMIYIHLHCLTLINQELVNLLLQGVGLTRAVSRGEVVARLGDEECEVKTLDDTHMYCEPPEEQPRSLNGLDLPSLTVYTYIQINIHTHQHIVTTQTVCDDPHWSSYIINTRIR